MYHVNEGCYRYVYDKHSVEFSINIIIFKLINLIYSSQKIRQRIICICKRRLKYKSYYCIFKMLMRERDSVVLSVLQYINNKTGRYKQRIQFGCFCVHERRLKHLTTFNYILAKLQETLEASQCPSFFTELELFMQVSSTYFA